MLDYAKGLPFEDKPEVFGMLLGVLCFRGCMHAVILAETLMSYRMALAGGNPNIRYPKTAVRGLVTSHGSRRNA